MKSIIIANWKMNPVTIRKAETLFNLVERGIKNIKKIYPELSRRIEVVICPPFIYLSTLGASAFAKGCGGLALGSQNVFWEEKGAFTGEISPKMLKDLGCQYVILGHSERRKYVQETDEMINKKIKKVLKAQLKPILCVDNVSQVKKGLKGVLKKDLKKLILAYEPIWAIGTGKACSLDKAKNMKNKIQRILGNEVKILYGGSVNSKNAAHYIKQAGFQGLLIGSASLNPKEFIKIIKTICRG